MSFKDIIIQDTLPDKGKVLSNGKTIYTHKVGINTEYEIYTKYIFSRYRWEEPVPPELTQKVHPGFSKRHNLDNLKTFPCLPEERIHLLKYIPIKAGDVAIEIGAFQGLGTVYLSDQVGEQGRVITLEPNKHDFAYVEQNIKVNNITNITAFNLGLWNTSTVLPLFCGVGTQNHSFVKDAVPFTNGMYKEIQTIPLDVLLQKHAVTPTIIVMESTCEGEHIILEGMHNTLSLDQLRIIISIKNYRINNMPAKYVIKQILESYNFKVYMGISKMYAIKGY